MRPEFWALHSPNPNTQVGSLRLFKMLPEGFGGPRYFGVTRVHHITLWERLNWF